MFPSRGFFRAALILLALFASLALASAAQAQGEHKKDTTGKEGPGAADIAKKFIDDIQKKMKAEEAEAIAKIQKPGGTLRTDDEPTLLPKENSWVDLNDCPVTNKDLAPIGKLRYLTRIELSRTQITDGFLKQLAPHKESLATLYLNETRIGDATLGDISAFENLFSLSLKKTDISDKGLKFLKKCRQLCALELSHTKITGAGLKDLAGMKELRSLFLNASKIDDEGMKHLEKFNLNTLEIANTQIGDEGLKSITACGTLISLNLRGTKVGDLGLSHLAKLERLYELNLADCRITNEGMTHLVSCKNLQSLELSGTGITDAGLKKLVPLSKDGKLQKLWLNRTMVSPAALKEMNQAFPNLEIYH